MAKIFRFRTSPFVEDLTISEIPDGGEGWLVTGPRSGDWADVHEGHSELMSFPNVKTGLRTRNLQSCTCIIYTAPDNRGAWLYHGKGGYLAKGFAMPWELPNGADLSPQDCLVAFSAWEDNDEWPGLIQRLEENGMEPAVASIHARRFPTAHAIYREMVAELVDRTASRRNIALCCSLAPLLVWTYCTSRVVLPARLATKRPEGEPMKRAVLLMSLSLSLCGLVSAPAEAQPQPSAEELRAMIFAPANQKVDLSSDGTCRVGCWGGPGSGTITYVYFDSTYQECCSRTIDPCPPGTSPAGYSFNGFKCTT